MKVLFSPQVRQFFDELETILYGKDLHYATFRKNKQTTWYAFFTKYYDENQQVIYLIRYIGNNHTEAQFL